MFEINIDTRGIPLNVLQGKVPKFISVHNTYRQVYIEVFMLKLHEAFWDKTVEDQSDKYGVTWDRLSSKTKEIKKNLFLQEEAGFGEVVQPQISGNFTNRRQLNSPQLAEQQSLYKKFIANRVNRTTAGRRALKAIGIDERYDLYNTPINVRTTRLAGAFTPVKTYGRRIYNGPDQRFTWSDDGLSLGLDISSIPYAEDVDEVRPLWKNHEIMMQEAVNESVDQALVVYQSLLSSNRKLSDDSGPSSKLD